MPVFGEPRAEREPRPPSRLDAVAPIVVPVVLLALTIVRFGIDAAGGPLQVALSVVATCLGLHIVAGDQSVAVVLPSRVFRVTFAGRGLNILNPVVAITYALTGFRIERVPPSDPAPMPPDANPPGGARDV